MLKLSNIIDFVDSLQIMEKNCKNKLQICQQFFSKI